MPYDPKIHHRRSIRLKGYDYTQPGAYFVTIATHRHQNLFGEIKNGEMVLNPIGEIVKACWHRLPALFDIQMDAWVIMPNHIHGIIVIDVDYGRGEASARELIRADASPLRQQKTQPQIGTTPGSLGAIVQNFKSVSTRKIHILQRSVGVLDRPSFSPTPIWQRNYYEHILRTEAEWQRIQAYIAVNPMRWEDDV